MKIEYLSESQIPEQTIYYSHNWYVDKQNIKRDEYFV